MVLPVLERCALLDQSPGHAIIRTPHVIQQTCSLATDQQYLPFEGEGRKTGSFLERSILAGSLPLQTVVRLPDFIVVVACFVLAGHNLDVSLVHETGVFEPRGEGCGCCHLDPLYAVFGLPDVVQDLGLSFAADYEDLVVEDH